MSSSRQGGGSGVRTHLNFAGLAASNLTPYVLPWALCVVAWPVGFGLHLWGRNDASIGTWVALATAGLTAFTWAVWGVRHRQTRLAAALFTGAYGAWLALAASSDPRSPGMVKAWAIGGMFLSAMWCMRRAGLASSTDADKPEGEHREGILERILNGRTKSVEGDAKQARARVQLKESNSAQAQHAKDDIAAALRVGTDEVSVVPVQGDASQVDIIIQRTKELAKQVRWAGVSAPGTSVADSPLMFAVRSDGRPMGLWVCGQDGDPDKGIEPRPLGHTLNTGVAGSGKTETTKTILIEGLSRTDFVPVVADASKFAQSFAEIEQDLSITADNERDARILVGNLPEAVRVRAAKLGRAVRSDGTVGYAQWEPECWTLHGIPLVFFVLSEATDILQGDNDDMDAAVRKARSIGILIYLDMQTAIHSNIERKTRGQFTQSLAHGMREFMDAKFSLSAATLEAGADPTKWQNNYPGSLYTELIGVPPAEWSMQARALFISRAQKAEELRRSREAGTRATMDRDTYEALTRGMSFRQASVEEIPQAAPVHVPGPAAGDDIFDGTEGSSDRAEDYMQISPDQGPDLDGDIAEPIPAPVGEPISLGVSVSSRVTPEQAKQLFDARIDELELQRLDVTLEALADLPDRVGRSRPWIYTQLQRLVNEGRLVSASGGLPYTIRPRATNGHRPVSTL